MRFKNKKASFDIIKETILHIFLIGLIFAIFLLGISLQTSSYNTKQQVLEKQTALLIDSAEAGMEFEIKKMNINGIIENVKVEDNKVFIKAEGLSSVKGYPYFSRYSVSVREDEDKFVVIIQ